MAKDERQIRKINYLSRDFDSIKTDLMEHAKRYYPDTYRDFNESSFGSLMLDTVAYVGDIMSFYLDYSVNESFMDTAVEYNNVIRHAKSMGYKFKGPSSTHGIVSIYCIVPAALVGMGPDSDYIPTLKKGARFTSNDGAAFLLLEDVHFNHTGDETVAAKFDTTTALPTHYAIKTYGRVVSGQLLQKNIVVGSYEKFRKIKVGGGNVAEILSVFDSDGHQYFEVDYLSQDVVYKDIVNKDVAVDNVTSILKPFKVPRRFVVEREASAIYLQFGAGSSTEISSPSVADPTNVVLNMFGRDFVSDESFDPSMLTKTDKFGIVPSSTTITVIYRTTEPGSSNASVGAIKKVSNSELEFPDPTNLDTVKKRDVESSIEVYNEEPIVGSVSIPTTQELKRRTYDTFATQNRAVTKTDYESLVYAMHPKYGSIKRCNIVRDPDSLKRNLNLYIIGEDDRGKLATANSTIKSNLKYWLNQYRMINDTIDILDAKIVNIGIEFHVVSHRDANRFDVLHAATTALKKKFPQPLYIGEPIYISDIYTALNKVENVVSVKKVKIVNKQGTNYSSTRFDIRANTGADGSYVKVPENVVVEVKYPNLDIKGTVE